MKAATPARMLLAQSSWMAVRRGATPQLHLARRPLTAPSGSGSGSSSKGTAIVMMNLGGPETTRDVYPFLHKLFADPDLIPIPFQRHLAPVIARNRTPGIEKQYDAIGGGSPIHRWTRLQGAEMCKLLDAKSPGTAPHVPLVAFRYTSPSTEDAIAEIQRRGLTRAVAFTQYPQYSCSTTGSSLNELYRRLQELDPKHTIRWSVIDRWPTHQGLIHAFAERIQKAIDTFYAPEDRDSVVLVFSAHSLPMTVVQRGDPYVHEVAATVQGVMDHLGHTHPYRLAWQSKVGPRAWMGPATTDVVEALGKKGTKNVLLVPIAFTSDHIETLYELDIELAEEARAQWGVTGIRRVESLNDSPVFIRALADLVHQHLRGEHRASTKLGMQCPMCTKEICATSKDFFHRNDVVRSAVAPGS